jgi:hypothetical protein
MEAVERLVSFEEAFLACYDEGYPINFRIAYAKIVRHVYVNRFPWKPVAQFPTLWVVSDSLDAESSELSSDKNPRKMLYGSNREGSGRLYYYKWMKKMKNFLLAYLPRVKDNLILEVPNQTLFFLEVHVLSFLFFG